MSLVIENGVIEERLKDQQVQKREYQMRKLNYKHLPQIMSLQQVIVEHLSRPDLLATFSEDFMRKHLTSHGFVVGIFVGRRLVAFRNVYFPASDDTQWNLGFDLGLNYAERKKVANLQMVCVHPDYRGNSLAIKMNRFCLDRLRRQGTHQHICATVSPYNFWNIRILLNCGFHIGALKNKYGAKLRYVVYQNLQSPLRFAKGCRIHIALDDIEMQRKLIGSQYFGVHLKKSIHAKEGQGKPPVSDYNLVFKQLSTNCVKRQHIVIPELWSEKNLSLPTGYPTPNTPNSSFQFTS